jgi:mycoredoxin
MTNSTDLPADGLVMFSTTWCGYCQRLKAQMGREGIEFTEIDIEAQPEWADFVAANNGGNHTVPTLRFPDGTVATNPPIGEVKARLGR